jgi:hypothetical protein
MNTNDEKLVLKEEVFRIVGYPIEVIGWKRVLRWQEPDNAAILIFMPESSCSCYPCNPWLKLL